MDEQLKQLIDRHYRSLGEVEYARVLHRITSLSLQQQADNAALIEIVLQARQEPEP